jgi:hypothetical protein
VEDENHSQTDYYISLDNKTSSPLVISEPEINYKKSKKSESEIEKITESLEEMKNLITILSDQISKGYAIIDEMKKVEKQNY